ncbi:MAG TPA: hypothetical protein VMR29_10305 [Candidatus Binatia bacterium]|nr:hypothetical protein [Candidatus Binatia bacterium]
MTQSKKLPVPRVTGFGPGLSASLARRFAKEYQHRSAWTMEMELRPFKEKF